LVVVVAVLVAGCGGQQSGDTAPVPAEQSTASSAASPASPPPSTTATDSGSPAPAGSYVSWDDYAADAEAYASGDVVLFFHASWCPDCRATEEALDSDGVAPGLTVVKVDFDTATDLRQRYGVTVQHTFVLIDGAGEAMKKWTGSRSGADIAAQLT